MKIIINDLPSSFQEKEITLSLKDANILQRGGKLLNFCMLIEHISKSISEIKGLKKELGTLKDYHDKISDKLDNIIAKQLATQEKLEAYKLVSRIEESNQFNETISLLSQEKQALEENKASLSNSLKDINRRIEELELKIKELKK